VTAEERKAYLDSLSFQQIDARLLNIKKAHDRTCNWLFEQLEYKQWLDRDLTDDHHGFLWIKGKPGAGKSTMMKHTLLKIRRLLASAAIVSFFFNARGDILERSTLGMYRSLLLQLLTAIPFLQDDFVRMSSRKRRHSDVHEWNIEELQEVFIAAVKGLQQHRLVCFIDALDECKENEVRELVEFLEGLGDIAVSSGTSLNICLSSRHYPHIRIQKGIQLIVERQGGHDKDIETYVESKFKVPHSKQMDDIRAEILSRASGVFLWVVLVVQMLNKEYDHGQIHTLRRRLSEIPDELDDLFADILMRDAERRDESILCLQWLLFAQRPLMREELYFAVLSGTEPRALGKWDPVEVSNQTIDRFILSCSKGLAEVSKAKDQTIQFIHESVRDFFLLRNGLSKLQPDCAANMVGLSQDRLKQCCYKYITTDMFEDLLNDEIPNANSQAAKDLRDKTSEKFPFLEYAVHNILVMPILRRVVAFHRKTF
jgi:KAP family P-loop domain